jgi:hypothetical protein
MVHALAKNWWMLLLRGIAAIIFGVLGLTWPGMTLVTLILFYGAYVLVDGVLAIVVAITGGALMPRWWLAIASLLGNCGRGADVLDAGSHRNRAAVFYRRLGDSDRGASDHRRDQAAQGDR